MSLSRSQIIIIGLVVLVIILFSLVLLGIIPGLRPDIGVKTNLTVWGVYDQDQVINRLFASAKVNLPNIAVTYVRKDPATYESDLLNALALNRAPDIVMLQNNWLPKYQDKLSPAPPDIINEKILRQLFPSVIEEDFSLNANIYALPLYLDSLALFYNTDMFDAANIANPPRTWEDFIKNSNTLKRLGGNNKINRASAALGGSGESINRASDLISLLMLQNGTSMVSGDHTRATFAAANNGTGLKALEFYTQFSNPRSPNYTWNDSLHYSVDSFSSGDTAMIFNYSHQIPVIKNKNPFLNFAVTPVPQIKDVSLPVNFANYFGLAVLRQSPNTLPAWQLLSNVLTSDSAMSAYSAATAKPPALRRLLPACQSDPDLSSFCSQSLTARSWFNPDPSKTDIIFSDLITDILSGRLTVRDSLKRAEDSVTALLKK